MQPNTSSIDVLDSLGHSGNFAFLFTVLVAMFTALPALQANSRRVGVFLLVGGLYCWLSVVAFTWVYNHHQRPYRYVYLVGQTWLALLMIWLAQAEGMIGIIIIPLASHAIFLLPLKQAYAFSLGLVIADGVIHYLSHIKLLTALNEILAYGAATVFIVVFTRVTIREIALRAEVEHLNDKLAEANQKLREFASQSAELAVAEERNRLAREIHDSLGHSLTAITIQLDAIRQLISLKPAKAIEVTQKAHLLAKQGLQDVRESVAEWRTSPLTGQSLPDAISRLVETAQQTGLHVTFEVVGETEQIENLPAQVKLTLYRATQEALTNVRKHTRATAVDLLLDFGSVIRLIIRDNGKNEGDKSQNDKMQAENGFGLLGVQERLQMLGGTLTASPQAEGGFLFQVEIPR